MAKIRNEKTFARFFSRILNCRLCSKIIHKHNSYCAAAVLPVLPAPLLPPAAASVPGAAVSVGAVPFGSLTVFSAAAFSPFSPDSSFADSSSALACFEEQTLDGLLSFVNQNDSTAVQ